MLVKGLLVIKYMQQNFFLYWKCQSGWQCKMVVILVHCCYSMWWGCMTIFNSLAPGRCDSHSEIYFSNSFYRIIAWAHYEIALRWMSQNTFNARWKVSIDSGNGLVPLGKKQLSKPMLNHGFISPTIFPSYFKLMKNRKCNSIVGYHIATKFCKVNVVAADAVAQGHLQPWY